MFLLTIRPKWYDNDDDDDGRELKCWNYIRVGQKKIQLNKNKDDEVIENDVWIKNIKKCVDIFVDILKSNVLTCERYTYEKKKLH